MTLIISICIVNLGFIIDHIDSIEYNSKENLNNPCISNFQSYQQRIQTNQRFVKTAQTAGKGVGSGFG